MRPAHAWLLTGAMAGLVGCTSPAPPAAQAPPSPAPSAAPIDTGPLGPAIEFLHEGAYPQAQTFLQTWIKAHPGDAAAALLADDAAVDSRPHKAVVTFEMEVAADTMKGDEELRSALIAQQDVNAHAEAQGFVVNVVPGTPGSIAHVGLEVVGAVADDAGVDDCLGSGVGFVSLLPPDPAIHACCVTPSAMSQWKATTAFLAHRVKHRARILVLMQRNQQPPSAIDWTRDFDVDLKTAGAPIDASGYAAVLVITPWNGAPGALASLTGAAHTPVWICDLLGQIPGVGQHPGPSGPPTAGTKVPEGAIVPSEFGVNKKDADQYRFAVAYAHMFHQPPGPWGWRTFHAVSLLASAADKGASRQQINATLQGLGSVAPSRWYLMQMRHGDWEYLETYEPR